MELHFCDETDWGVGWIAPEPAYMQRCSHALSADGRVWLTDPVDGPGIDDRVRALGEPAGVIQLLDRHGRDCLALARRLGVPLFVTPARGTPGLPFETIAIVRTRFWREVALWWPERNVLVCGDALGTASYYLAPGDRLGVHPLLRLVPPERLGALEPEHVLCGHGEGVHDGAADALRDALATSGRRIPSLLYGLGRSKVRG